MDEVEGVDIERDEAALAMIPEFGYPLNRTNTAEVPPNAPLQLQLKKWDSYSRCFKKLDPHMEWLSQFMQKNNWITAEKLDRWNKLVGDYQTGRDKPDPPSSFDEFLKGEGHRQARALYTRYQQLRKDLVDMATKRRSFKASEQLALQIALSEKDREILDIAKLQRQTTTGSRSPETGLSLFGASRDSGYGSRMSPSTDEAFAETPSILKSESSTPAREQPSIRFA
ncbi:hypothetical protein FRC01_009034 [Tulasnella sp. 417]|nr:hypothetical protein FRC01_009034 [Tulasnella sp. 417]